MSDRVQFLYHRIYVYTEKKFPETVSYFTILVTQASRELGYTINFIGKLISQRFWYGKCLLKRKRNTAQTELSNLISPVDYVLCEIERGGQYLVIYFAEENNCELLSFGVYSFHLR